MCRQINIITEGFPKDDEIMVDEVLIKYYQEPDCTEDRDGDGQELILSTRDGGGGKFINIKSTTGWSVSDESDIVTVINDFKKRVGIK